MNNTAELVRLKEEQLRLSQNKREHENKLSAILALIRKEGRMTREKYQQCCDAQIRHKQGIKRVDEMISSVKIKIFELSQLENQNKQSMERRLVDLERENAELREAKDAYFKHNNILVQLMTEEQKKKALDILIKPTEAQP